MQIHRCSSLVATIIIVASVCVAILIASQSAEARSMSAADYARDQEESASAVIPSPNQIFDDETDIVRKTEPEAQQQPKHQIYTSHQAMSASPVPVYVSQYLVPARPYVGQPESSQPSVDFASRSAAMEETSAAMPERSRHKDLKVSASYGQGHHGSSHHGYSGGHHDEHHGHDHHGKGHDSHGWLDMGAYTGKKGSFGWHADYPVGGKSHGYGK